MHPRFDLSKPETLLLPDVVEEQLHGHMTVELFRKILIWAKGIEVSDISFQVDFPIKIKKNNMVFNISRCALQPSALIRMVGIIYGAADGDDSAYQRVMAGKDNQSTYTFTQGAPGQEKESFRFRTSVLRDGADDVSIIMRLNRDEILTLDKIGQSPQGPIYQNMFPLKGLNFITGSVDSGKTTLLYACMVEFILHSKRGAFINTFENPIEGDLRRVARENKIHNKVVSQCPVPIGVSSYLEAIDVSLRRNTDIIVLGEIRTQEEVMGAIKGVLSTGKLIIGTLHTQNIPVSFSRLINTLQSSNEGQMRALVYDLISSMNMIVSQTLLQTVDLKRVAVNEVLIFTKEVKARLLSVPMERLSAEITAIMKESNNTMVDMARKYFEAGVISSEIFEQFMQDFSY